MCLLNPDGSIILHSHFPSLSCSPSLFFLCLLLNLQSVFGDGENTKVRVSELEEEVRTLKKVNKDLYDFSTQLLTKPS